MMYTLGQSGQTEHNKSALMRKILEVRYTDLEEEKQLCKQLLEVAEPNQDTYSCAFANVYLFDSLLALGDFANCDFYLIRASMLCREHAYEDLLLALCTFAGLYYLKLGDEQTALEYNLEGLMLANRLSDYETAGKLLNNIGTGFGGRGDWETARDYFEQAIGMVRSHPDVCSTGNAISYLSNLAEAFQNLGEIEGSRHAMEQCEHYDTSSLYHKFRLGCGWCAHYAAIPDRERCVAQADRLLEMGLLEYDNLFFVSDMCIGLVEMMLDVSDHARAHRFIEILEEREAECVLVLVHRIQRLKILFWERIGAQEKLDSAYRAYYESSRSLSVLEDQARAQSMLSKIQLTNVQLEREEMRNENRELENAGQLDELTGLYNRRYFNKLVSKMAQSAQQLQTQGFVMIDIDYFKQFNDFYGHFEGDRALRHVAEVLSEYAREGIYVSRYGGDEYVCYCVNLSDELLERYVSDVHHGILQKCIPNEKSPQGEFLSLSIGYCNESDDAISAEQLLQLADEALYQVKRNGRNGFTRKRISEAAPNR